jgi:hypothetical protein
VRAPLAAQVDEARDELAAGAGLAEEEDRLVVSGGGLDLVGDGAHGIALDDEELARTGSIRHALIPEGAD